MVEVNFVIDEVVVTVVYSAAVPAEGAVVQIAKTDYVATKVFWAVDHERQSIQSRMLRAIVELEKAATQPESIE